MCRYEQGTQIFTPKHYHTVAWPVVTNNSQKLAAHTVMHYSPLVLCTCQDNQHPHTLTAMQVLRRSSVDVISPFLDPYLDVIMSVEGTRMRLLALSSLVPGASTLIANLLRSSGPNAGFAGGPGHGSNASRRFPWASSSGSNGSSPTSSFDSQDESLPAFGWQQKLQAAVRSLDDVMINHPYSTHGSSGSSRRVAAGGAAVAAGAQTGTLAGRRWLREYADGAHCELFMVPVGPSLAGLRFTDAAQAVYEASGAMVVGVIEVSLPVHLANCTIGRFSLLDASCKTFHLCLETDCLYQRMSHCVLYAATCMFPLTLLRFH